jgi:hypothetical protein
MGYDRTTTPNPELLRDGIKRIATEINEGPYRRHQIPQGIRRQLIKLLGENQP